MTIVWFRSDNALLQLDCQAYMTLWDRTTRAKAQSQKQRELKRHDLSVHENEK